MNIACLGISWLNRNASGNKPAMKLLLLAFVILMGIKHCYAQKFYPESEVSETYKTGTNYGFGIRGGYRFLKYFTATVDVEWQQVRDERVRTTTFNSSGTGRVVKHSTV
jgi:hypothetical protein